MTAPLYRRLLGSQFDTLPARVRDLHDLSGTTVWCGVADVERGTSWPSRVLAGLFRLPPAGRDLPLRVTFTASEGRELWVRSFGHRAFVSTQFERRGLLAERIGLSTLLSVPVVTREGLALDLRAAYVLGILLPRLLMPQVRTLESERDGRYRFLAEAHLPISGLLVRYAGWLEREPGAASA